MKPFVSRSDEDAEIALLGAMLRYPGYPMEDLTAALAGNPLVAEDFWLDGNGMLFSAIQKIDASGAEILARRIAELRNFPGPGKRPTLFDWCGPITLAVMIEEAADVEEMLVFRPT
jgi:hypothetical protein